MATRSWDTVPIFGWWQVQPGVPVGAGSKVTFTIVGTDRVRRRDGRMIYPGGVKRTVAIGSDADQDATVRARVHDAMRAAAEDEQGAGFDPIAWEAAWTEALPSAIFTSFYAADDPDITPNGWQVKVEESLAGAAGKTYMVDPLVAQIDPPGQVPGINLADIEVPPGTPTNPAPTYAKGQPGGVAALDADGDVVDADGTKILTGTGGTDLTSYETQIATLADYPATFPPELAGVTPADIGAATSAQGAKADTAVQPADLPATPTWSTLSDKPAVIAAGTSATAARDAIGAGTSSLQLGTGPTTAAAGDHGHDLNAVTDTATRLAMTPAERTKLSGVATGATANATDAQLRDRATHTGTQAISTVTGLQGALDGKQAAGTYLEPGDAEPVVPGARQTVTLTSTADTDARPTADTGVSVIWLTTYSTAPAAMIDGDLQFQIGA